MVREVVLMLRKFAIDRVVEGINVVMAIDSIVTVNKAGVKFGDAGAPYAMSPRQ